MFDKLIPWKKKNDGLEVYHDEHPIARLRHEFDSVWERFWDDWKTGGLSNWQGTRMFGPRVDWDDNDKEYVLRAELPGFEAKDIDVKISGNVLTLRAERKEEGKGENGDGSYHRLNRFYETISLPQTVLADKIDASYHSGVLEVHLPKDESCQGKRIEVKLTK